MADETDMLQLLEQLTIDKQVFKNFEENRKFLGAHPKTPMPPVVMLVDAQGHWDYGLYYRSGRKGASQIAGWIKEFLGDRPIRFLEWGCGPARFLRHMAAVAGERNEYHGTDYNGGTIDWCKAHIGGIDFRKNELDPPLPFENDRFDFIFSRSVFTHLTKENGLLWMAELRRVVAPGGVICFSTGGDTFLSKLSPADRAQYQSGEPVISERDVEGQKLFSIKHPPLWVGQHMTAGLDLLRFMPGEGTQDIWLLRAPA